MILIESGNRSLQGFDAKAVFARLLAARGHRVALDPAALPADMDRNRRFEIAPYLVDTEDLKPERLILIGADALHSDTLSALRDLDLPAEAPVVAIGRFASHQSHVSARAQIAYATGREPRMIDLAAFQPRPLVAQAMLPLVAATEPAARPAARLPRLTVVLSPRALEEPDTLPVLAEMERSRRFTLRIIASGEQRELINTSRHYDLPTVTFSELSPVTLTATSDIVVIFGQGVPGERIAALAVGVMGAGGVVIDCTDDAAILACGAPALRGPLEPAALLTYLTDMVLVNVMEIGRRVSESPWLRGIALERLEAELGLEPPQRPADGTGTRAARTVFMPTNGVGLGHAQRCSVIAAELAADSNTAFAAFPSCVPLVTRRGFPCMPLVQKSDQHAASHANDLMNYLRLRQLLVAGDRLVFDGGYIFDSVFRVILEQNLTGIWIRRGLWPQGRANGQTLDRERVFESVIVPQEAFPELNEAYSFGSHVHEVGPILREAPTDAASRADLRDGLARRFGVTARELVVSMLGGGVASERTAQLQALCATFDARRDCLHLIVVWPGSPVAPALFGWKNSRVVQTLDALALCQAADLVISAAGYNSVHEILYHAIPAILVPQVAPYLDDQARRARALSDRGLAETVMAPELLKLERAVSACLDRGLAHDLRTRLAAADLPATGAARAAALIAAAGKGTMGAAWQTN